MRSLHRSIRWDLALLLCVGVLAIAAIEVCRSGHSTSSALMVEASDRMLAGIQSLRTYREAYGPAIDPAHDINQTGLIGAQFTSTTTTVGDLQAKRTTTNPNTAGLMALLLSEAGVHDGDFIAVGASGSFPAMILATLCAAQAMHLDVALIVSLGASQWGANLPGFSWLDIEDVLYADGITPYRTIASSLGGADDVADDLTPAARQLLLERIEASSATLISEPDLSRNVDIRMSIYRDAAGDRPIVAFVNVGGSWVDLGTDASVLSLTPGVNESVPDAPPARGGVIQAMARDGVPVIHLLNIKQLAQEYGLAWDPSPLPPPGSLRVPEQEGRGRTCVVVLAIGYLVVVAGWLAWLRLRQRPKGGNSG